MEIDAKNSTIFNATQSYASMNLISLKGLGTPKKGLGNKLPFTYLAKDTMGMDTVLYENVPGKQCAYLREVEVQSLKYLTLKVYLWGAWRSASNSMYAFLDKNNLNKFSNMKDNSGAFFESPYDSNCKITTNRLREILQDKDAVGERYVDWVEVDIVEAEPTGATNRPFHITHKVDSVSALLRTDGIVCDTLGNPYIAFKNVPNNDYYIVIRHRNHLGMMSGVKVALLMSKPTTTTPIAADFTSTIFSIAGTPNVAYYRSANVNYMYV